MATENKRRVLVLAIGVLASAVLGAAVATTLLWARLPMGGPVLREGVLRARRIIIQGKDGRPRVLIGVTPSGRSYCALYDLAGKPDAGLSVDSAANPMLWMSRPGGCLIEMAVDGRGTPSLLMKNKQSFVTMAAGEHASSEALSFGPPSRVSTLNLTAANQTGQMSVGVLPGLTSLKLSVDGASSSSSLDMLGGGSANAYLDVGPKLLALNMMDRNDSSAGMSVNGHSQSGVYVKDARGMKLFHEPGPYAGP